MARQQLDLEKLSKALRRLRKQELLELLDDALEMLPQSKIEALVEDYVDLDKLRPSRLRKGQLLAEVKRFETSSLAGDYYESFNVNSKNYRDKSEGTATWIDECNRLLDRCVAYSTAADHIELCTAFETIFGLLRFIDMEPDKIIFFADEPGAWQVGVDWDEVLPVWIRCLSATTEPEEYARRVIKVVDQHHRHNREEHFTAARKAGTPAQAKALGPQRRRQEMSIMGKSKNRRKKPRSGSRRTKRRAVERVDGRAQSLLEGLGNQLARLPLGPCFVSEGWEAEGAMVSVCITRQLPGGKLVVIVFLVDLACLGVKSIIAKKMGEVEFPRFRASFTPSLERAEPALAVKIVTTGVAYAEQFELRPAPEYELARLIFGDIAPEETDEVIRTGMKGKPCYIAGPHDDVETIMAHLMETLGPDNFHFIAAAEDFGIRF